MDSAKEQSNEASDDGKSGPNRSLGDDDDKQREQGGKEDETIWNKIALGIPLLEKDKSSLFLR